MISRWRLVNEEWVLHEVEKKRRKPLKNGGNVVLPAYNGLMHKILCRHNETQMTQLIVLAEWGTD